MNVFVTKADLTGGEFEFCVRPNECLETGPYIITKPKKLFGEYMKGFEDRYTEKELYLMKLMYEVGQGILHATDKHETDYIKKFLVITTKG